MSLYTPSDADEHKIDAAFTYHKPHGDQPQRYVEIRDRAKALAVYLAENCPASRELSLGLTALENCVMWCNASIARNESDEE